MFSESDEAAQTGAAAWITKKGSEFAQQAGEYSQKNLGPCTFFQLISSPLETREWHKRSPFIVLWEFEFWFISKFWETISID